MTVNNFIPEIWSAQVFQDYETKSVLSQLCNRNYEGDITGGGDTVRITKIGPITVNTYTMNSTADITVQTLADTQSVLTIDQQKYFAFQIDDVDKAQTKPKIMADAVRQSGIALAKDVDNYIGALYSQAGASTYASVTIASTDYAFLTMCGRAMQLLDEMDAPSDGRWAVIPPFVNAQMVKQNIMLTQGQNAPLFTAGYLGRFMGFDVLMSNNLQTGSTHTAASPVYEAMFGTNDAITFADQIVETEALRMPNKFADEVRGLHVYGTKVIQPKALVTIEARST
jgi:hypothetical protein